MSGGCSALWETEFASTRGHGVRGVVECKVLRNLCSPHTGDSMPRRTARRTKYWPSLALLLTVGAVAAGPPSFADPAVFVSADHGDDSHSCMLADPCRTFR